MKIVVTGIGPRCGSSAMMKRLVDKGYSYLGSQYPAHGVDKYNPAGYYELELPDYKEPIVLEENQCVKLWPGHLHLIDPEDIDLLIIMIRQDRVAQIKSTVKVGRAEGLPMSLERASAMIQVAETQLNPYLKRFNFKVVYTEKPDTVEAYL